MRLDDEVRVRHILDAAAEAQSFVAGRSERDLTTDRMLMRALVNCIEVVGEAANQLTPEFRAAHPGIDWPAVVGMRNRLIHAYFDINLRILWRTVTEDLPGLVGELQRD